MQQPARPADVARMQSWPSGMVPRSLSSAGGIAKPRLGTRQMLSSGTRRAAGGGTTASLGSGATASLSNGTTASLDSAGTRKSLRSGVTEPLRGTQREIRMIGKDTTLANITKPDTIMTKSILGAPPGRKSAILAATRTSGQTMIKRTIMIVGMPNGTITLMSGGPAMIRTTVSTKSRGVKKTNPSGKLMSQTVRQSKRNSSQMSCLMGHSMFRRCMARLLSVMKCSKRRSTRALMKAMLRTCSQRARQSPHHIPKLHGPRRSRTKLHRARRRRMILMMVGALGARKEKLPSLQRNLLLHTCCTHLTQAESKVQAQAFQAESKGS
mmetsp:Transcript_163294/g.289190  ORF Transcript_163294/g.289190 Transcript_163294/m.289190 type:complete len:325 (+) Transcript_163294:187-1161(+)